MAPKALSPLNLALTHLETAERALAAQLIDAVKVTDSIQVELGATREAIAGLRKIDGARGSAAPPPIDPTRQARRSPVRRAAPASGLQKGHAGADSARARTSALLLLMVDGPRESGDLRRALSMPADATNEQHRASVSNALTRMKGEGLVSLRADGWTLTAKGRKSAAAPPAKEAP